MTDAVNIDLSTYDGDDPCLILEPACQSCQTKASETTLSLCPRCSLVSYCSQECSAMDFYRHRTLCTYVVRSRETIRLKALELRRTYGFSLDIYKCSRQGRAIRPSISCSIFSSFIMAHTELADALYKLADQSGTVELFEEALEWHLKRVSLTCAPGMMNIHGYMGEKHLVHRIPFILIRLNRLDDACGFIQKYVAYWNAKGGAQVSDWYECHGAAGARFKESAALPALTRMAKSVFHIRRESIPFLLALLIIKMRIRHAAARNAWETTLNDVFLLTCRGRELQPAFFALSEMYSLSDDTEQKYQIRKIASIIHRADSWSLRNLVEQRHRYEYTRKCIERTPEARETLIKLVQRNINGEAASCWCFTGIFLICVAISLGIIFAIIFMRKLL